jgi:hypothetical protein
MADQVRTVLKRHFSQRVTFLSVSDQALKDKLEHKVDAAACAEYGYLKFLELQEAEADAAGNLLLFLTGCLSSGSQVQREISGVGLFGTATNVWLHSHGAVLEGRAAQVGASEARKCGSILSLTHPAAAGPIKGKQRRSGCLHGGSSSRGAREKSAPSGQCSCKGLQGGLKGERDGC